MTWLQIIIFIIIIKIVTAQPVCVCLSIVCELNEKVGKCLGKTKERECAHLLLTLDDDDDDNEMCVLLNSIRTGLTMALLLYRNVYVRGVV